MRRPGRISAKSHINKRMNMRDLISLTEGLGLPSKLYHGTSRSGWESIRESNTLIAHDPLDYISFTEDYNTAFRFARSISRKFGESGDGVLLVLDGIKLAEQFSIMPCLGDGALYGFKEWRIKDGVLPNLKDFLIEVEDNSHRGDLYEAKKKVKMRPNAEDIRAIRRIRHDARREEGGGMCHVVSEWIEHIFGWERVSGTYLCKDGDIICGGGHLWNILPDGAILDATADQFGEGYDIRIIEPDDPDWKRYDIEWFEDWHPGHPDYDPTWERARRTPDKYTGVSDIDAQNIISQERGHRWWLKDRTHIEKYDAMNARYEDGEFGVHPPRWDKKWAYGDED